MAEFNPNKPFVEETNLDDPSKPFEIEIRKFRT